jgi:hypothetical protein
MTADETRAFLEAGTLTATVAAVRRDGRPRAVPVWFVSDRGDLVFTAGERDVVARADVAA